MSDPNPDDIESLFAPPLEPPIETHISRIYLSGDRAFKLKKAVRLPYVDFSTLELRRIACEREVALNRRTAPQLYLGCRAVYRDVAGRPTFTAQQGGPVEWLVEMRRFDTAQTFDRLLKRNAVTPAMIENLAEAIAAFHSAAETVPREADAAMQQVMALNDAAFADSDPAALSQDDADAFRLSLRHAFAAVQPRLAGRRKAGHMRHGHGDLHLRNIVLLAGAPVLFDCLEFDDDLAAIDALYDFAFLLMDLLAAGRRDLANAALNRYLEASADDEGMALLPFYIATRAAIRCHIAALKSEGRAEAQRYLQLGKAVLEDRPRRLIAIGGFSGTGKTTLARALAPDLGLACGAVILRSDTIRKRLHGIPLHQRLPEETYTPESSRRVYAVMQERAARLLAAGASVILDAVAGRAEERAAAAALARQAGCRFDGLWLVAPAAVQEQRVMERRGDASDADAAVVRWQQANLDMPQDWRRIDTSAGLDEIVRQAGAILAHGTGSDAGR